MVAPLSVRILPGSLLVATVNLSAQTVTRTEAQIGASHDTHQGDFDYLLGDWEFRAVSKQWGPMHGFWSATRLPAGAQILDEYRVVGDSGETYHVSNTLRVYNAVLDQWELATTEGNRGFAGCGHRAQGGRRDAHRAALRGRNSRSIALADPVLQYHSG